MTTRLGIPLATVAALLTLAPIAPAAQPSAEPIDAFSNAGNEPTSLVGHVTRRISVDGRPVDISVTVRNVLIPVTAGSGSRALPAAVRVGLDSGDGEALPEITAIRVRLERVRPPLRIYRSTLYPELTFAADPLHAGYAANITSFHPGVRLKATVIVETPHETRYVRVGQVRVRPPAPLANPVIAE